MKPLGKIIGLLAGASLLVYSITVNLVMTTLGSTTWQVAKDFAISVTADIVAEYLKPTDTSQETLTKTEQQLAELNKKIDGLKEQNGSSPQLQTEFKQLTDTLNQMYQEMDQTFTQRQQQMEDHLASIREVQQQLETTTSSEKSVQFPISYQFRPAKDKTGQFQTLSNGSILQSGDTYKVIFTPNETLYVYIFQKDASNQIQRIFPMTEFKGVQVNNHNPVAANKQYILPAKTKSFRLDNTTGTEKIYFIASRYQDAVLENLPTTLTLPKTKEATVALFEQTKGFSDIIEDNHLVTLQWQEEQQDMTAVLNTKLESCDGCVNTLTFVHQ